MALKIMTLRNYLPQSKKPYYARAQINDVIEEGELMDLMSKGRTTLTKTDLLGAMQLFKEEIIRNVSAGRKVRTSIGSISAGVSGSLNSADEAFTPKDPNTNHEVRIYFQMEKKVEQEILTNLKTVRVEYFNKTGPTPATLRSVQTVEPNRAKPKDLIHISGARLKFDSADPEQGVFFVDDQGTESRSNLYGPISPSSVMAEVPQDVPAGNYMVVVRTKPNGKDLREGTLESPLAISA